MSLLPVLLGTSNPNKVFTSHLDNYKRALSNLLSSIDQDGVLLSIDVKDFEPSEVSVATADSTIIVEGKHQDEENTNNCRHFVRKYTLPATVDNSDITTFSSDGLFTIYVPSKLKPTESSRLESTERKVPMERTEEAVKSKSNVYEPTVRIIPIQLTDEKIKSPSKTTVGEQVIPKKQIRKILRFENIEESTENLKEQTPEERLITRKLCCCCQ